MNPHQKNKVDISVLCPLYPPPQRLQLTFRPVPQRRRTETLPPLRQTPQQERFAPEQTQGTPPPSLPFFPLTLPHQLHLYPHSLLLSTAMLTPHLQERKYFDSGDYALSKAGKASEGGVTSIGSQHPLPENIPHLTSPTPTNGSSSNNNGNGGPHSGSFSSGSVGGTGSFSGGMAPPVSAGGQSGSPVKEASFLHRGMSVDEQGEGGEEAVVAEGEEGKKGVPGRWQS